MLLRLMRGWQWHWRRERKRTRLHIVLNRVEQRALHPVRHLVAAAAREMVSDGSGMLVRIQCCSDEVVTE